MGGLKPYIVDVTSITVSGEHNLKIQVTPSYNQNELPYFEAYTPRVRTSEEPHRSAYFHFKDKQMEFFRGEPQWKVTDSDIEHIREALLKANRNDPEYTNWQIACYCWNVGHEIIDFNAPMEQYFQGLFDKANKNNRSYIPHDQKIPDTWSYAPPHRIRKRIVYTW